MTNLNNTNSPISREERNSLNENWQLLTQRFSHFQRHLNLLAGEDVEGIITNINERIAETDAALQQIETDLGEVNTAADNANSKAELAQTAADIAEQITALAQEKIDFIEEHEEDIRFFTSMQTNLQAQVDQLVISGDSSPEAAQARVGTDGTQHNTLKARLDAEIGQVTTQLAHIAVNVQKFGAKGDGKTDDTQAIQNALDSMVNGSTLFFPNGTYLISKPLSITKSDITLKGNYSYVKYATGVDGIVFVLSNLRNVNIDGIGSSNTLSAQTFIKATSVHHLHITTANFDGMKLGFDLTDCYWTKLESLRFQNVYKCFEFKSGTNAWLVENVSINGSGVPSTIHQCTSGGTITGSSFEGTSGRLNINTSSGINIDGNYFEGYNAEVVDDYISIGVGNYKVTNGISITGNMFYTGAKSGITLLNVSGIAISGNFFGTAHALTLYCFDGSNQTSIGYSANHYGGTSSNEFLIRGSSALASVSPELSIPIILKNKNIQPRTLTNGELAIFNESGKLKISDSSGSSEVAFKEDTLKNISLASVASLSDIFSVMTTNPTKTGVGEIGNASTQEIKNLLGVPIGFGNYAVCYAKVHGANSIVLHAIDTNSGKFSIMYIWKHSGYFKKSAWNPVDPL